jgi:hypothetical protein
MRERRAQKIEQRRQRHQHEHGFEPMRDQIAELEQAADRPAGRGACADEFGPDQHRDAGEGQGVSPIDGAAVGQISNPFAHRRGGL